MGVTKQAARKRFVPKDPGAVDDLDAGDGFNRFTPRARNVVMAAHNAAVEAGGAEIRPAHLVLGLLTEPDAIAAGAITGAGVTLEAVHTSALATLPPPVEHAPTLVPYGPEARKVLEITFREALRLGHNYIGTEHLLLALIETEPDDGLFATLGIDKATIERFVVDALSSR
jgi:ATP-dependent Clp protease ATP-binding subunit ClpA